MENCTDIDHDKEESTDSNDVKLMKAVMKRDTEYVRHLLRLGTVNVNYFIKYNDDSPSCTPLQGACACGFYEIVELLIEFGADVNKLIWKDGSPLILASQWGHAEVVKILLRHGARVNVGVLESGSVPAIFKATASGRTEVVKILLEHDSTLAGLQTMNGYTCLPLACSNGSTEIAKLLLKYGAPVDIIAGDGSLSLKEASKFGYGDIVELLLQHGAQLDLHTRDGITALISACEAGHTKVVKILLEHGANTSLIGKNGTFALERACKMGHCAIVKLLIKHKANVNMANQIGLTALMSASVQGHFKIVKVLLKAGADIKIRAKDPGERTVVEFAAQNGNAEIVNLLLGRPTMKEAFISLLPLAAKWKTIGFLLDLDDKSLADISCSTDEEALKSMLQIWLKTPRPSWETLAESIEPLDENIAEKINSYNN